MAVAASEASRIRRQDRAERQRVVLDTAARLFYERGVHEVGMDELVRETGLGKATVYRLFATKDQLISAYLHRLSTNILESIDTTVASHPGDAAGALDAVLDAVEADVRRPGFRGCAFNNASIEFDDPEHPARVAARGHRAALWELLGAVAGTLPGARAGSDLGTELAALIDGAYTSAAHLGPDGPAAAALALGHRLVDEARQRQ